MYITTCRTVRAPNRIFALSAATAALCVALIAQPAHADDAADVSNLLRAGQHAQALSKADAFLRKNPKDAQMRFLKGVILTEQNKSADAIAVFSKLTQDYPALPEPYNNLAVLYAANGQYDKARVALDAAIRTNPTYATAYENLGDVHAKLASQAYDKALQLDSGNSGAKSKLTLVRSLVGNLNDGATAKPAAVSDLAQAESAKNAPSKPAAPAPSRPDPVAVVAAAKPEPKVESKPAPKPAPKPEPKAEAKAESKPQAKPETKPEPKADAKPAANDEKAEVLAAVHGWAKAWAAQDMKAYLDSYASDFRTPGGRARKAWEEERRVRIVGKDRISVKVESPQVTVKGNTATVKFHQVYISDRLTANTGKTLTLTRNGGKWQIKQEQTGS